jgi:hypothetical protein
LHWDWYSSHFLLVVSSFTALWEQTLHVTRPKRVFHNDNNCYFAGFSSTKCWDGWEIHALRMVKTTFLCRTNTSSCENPAKTLPKRFEYVPCCLQRFSNFPINFDFYKDHLKVKKFNCNQREHQNLPSPSSKCCQER